MPAEFYPGPAYQDASEPTTIVTVHESDIWPVDDNSGSTTKDDIAGGLHPVVAIGGRTAADGRPLNLTGFVVSFQAGLTKALGIVNINIADGQIIHNYVANVLTYANNVPSTFEQAPIVGQPVYVDDSNDLGEGVTLSMSQFNDSGTLRNPLAGYLWYCQDEMADSVAGGPRAAATFDGSLADELVEQAFCVLLINAARELSDIEE